MDNESNLCNIDSTCIGTAEININKVFKNNGSCNIKFTGLVSLYELGFKPVPLSENHVPAVTWSDIYDNPDYWQVEKFSDPNVYSKFKNIASTVGKSHIKDPENKELFIQVLDVDSQYICDILSKPISQLINGSDIFKPIIQELLKSIGITDESKPEQSTILEICKSNTFVTKTKKPYGYHIWWLSHNQNKSISTGDCKKDCEFEIKADKSAGGLCTLPPSTHRDNKDFTYSAIGKIDKLLVNDMLYDLFIELFKDALVQKNSSKINTSQDAKAATAITFPTSQTTNTSNAFYNLSSETISYSASMLSPFYIENHRNSFTLCFSGLSYQSRISEESAVKILTEICKIKNDKDLKERINTLHHTYENASAGRQITGGPTLAELISNLNECDIAESQESIKFIKDLWRRDICINHGIKIPFHSLVSSDNSINKINDSNSVDNSSSIVNGHSDLSPPPPPLNIISVSQAKMLNEGHVMVRGKIMKATSSFKMIYATSYICSNSECSFKTKAIHARPLYFENEKESDKVLCTACKKPSVSIIHDYINAVEIELQDTDNVNEIDRLLTYLFENNIQSIKIGETAIVDGNIAVINKNDNRRKKKIAALYGNSIYFENEKEIVLTDKDIEEITRLKNEKGDEWIDFLVSQFAPYIARNYYPKLGLLAAAVSSGPDEIFRKKR
jgi:hypothetical protein